VHWSLEEFCSLLSDKMWWLAMLQDPWRSGFLWDARMHPLLTPKPFHKPLIYKMTHSKCTFCPSCLIWFRHWYLCLYLALGLIVSWNINTGLWSKHSLFTRKVVGGVLYPYNSDKTNAQKSEICTKIDVYSYRRAHRRASCSAGVICRGCGVVTCNTQRSV